MKTATPRARGRNQPKVANSEGYIPSMNTGACGWRPTLRKPDVVIVEDDAIAVRALDALLRDEGFSVRSARTVAEGCRLIDEQSPAVVLLDLMLLDGCGLNVLEYLRDRGCTARIIILTAEYDAELLDKCRALGAEAILRKPIDFTMVLSLSWQNGVRCIWPSRRGR